MTQDKNGDSHFFNTMPMPGCIGTIIIHKLIIK